MYLPLPVPVVVRVRACCYQIRFEIKVTFRLLFVRVSFLAKSGNPEPRPSSQIRFLGKLSKNFAQKSKRNTSYRTRLESTLHTKIPCDKRNALRH